MDKIRKLSMLPLILVAVCVFSRPAQADTSIYVFSPDQSTVIKTGGFAGVHITYTITGQLQLAVDSEAGTASFEIVDANLTDETGAEYGRNLDEAFNMTGLASTVIGKTTIEFAGKTGDGTESDVRLKLSFNDGLVHLAGNTTPPPNSADLFFYDIDAVATKKYAGGTGEPNDPYLIATAEDLITLGETPEDYDKHFVMTADIDLDPNLLGRKVFDRAVIASDVNDPDGDFQGTAFTGIFDGNGHTVLHLTMMGGDYLGLFGQLDFGAMVSNLGLEVVDVNGGDWGRTVGGLVGQNYGRITMSFCTGTVSSRFGAGGIVGKNWGNINNCNSNCSVSGWEQIGGLVGSNYGNILASFSTGTVTADEDLGGLVGINWRDAQITNSYSNCSVSGRMQVGGLVGSNRSSIINSYSTGVVGGSGYVGGLTGSGSGSITMSFWDMETSGQTTSDGGTGLTTAEMQTAKTYLDSGWDFVGETENGTDDIWSICEGTNYPRFVWQIPVGDFICPDGVAIEDFSFLMEHWLDVNCDSSNGYCEGTDLDQSGSVDATDLEIFFENWPDK